MDRSTPDTPSETEEENRSFTTKEFLETAHPSVAKPISDLWDYHSRPSGGRFRELNIPDIRLHCSKCEGERKFRCQNDTQLPHSSNNIHLNVKYTCGDCQETNKLYSLHINIKDDGRGELYKYGELPPFGIPLPNKVLRLFGKDAGMFHKGRQCENLGYGVAAFAYYRRVVESHKNDIFDEIIKVCRTVGASDTIIVELEKAKGEVSFSKAIEAIKSALPQGLLINGHNPLLALHGALSVGLHDESDEDCLAAAHAVRLVLSDLVEKMATLKQDNSQLNNAVQLLLRKKA